MFEVTFDMLFLHTQFGLHSQLSLLYNSMPCNAQHDLDPIANLESF